MEKDRGFRVLAIIAIVVSIAGLTIGFASLSQTLDINTSTALKGSQWVVKFDDLQLPTLTGKATSTAQLDSDCAVLTVSSNLKVPGDKVVYEFDVVNGGDIDAKLKVLPVFSGETQEATAAKINYSLEYSDGTALQANDTLDAGQTRGLVLTLEYDSTVTEVPSVDETFELNVALLYIQN